MGTMNTELNKKERKKVSENRFGAQKMVLRYISILYTVPNLRERPKHFEVFQQEKTLIHIYRFLMFINIFLENAKR